MRNFVRFVFNFFRAVFRPEFRFVRLTPFAAPFVLFFDKSKFRFFKILTRDRIDSVTCDQIFVFNDYRLEFLSRYPDLIEFYERTVKLNRKPIIVDGGANIGVSSVFFARCFPEAVVLAIEPEPKNFELLSMNVQHFKNIICVNKALGPRSGYARLTDSESDNNAFQFIQTESSQNAVAMTSVGDVLQLDSNSVPFIAKIDIEGFENELFSENVDWVDVFPLLIVETHDWMLPRHGTAQNFLKVISVRDRDFVHFHENVFSIAWKI